MKEEGERRKYAEIVDVKYSGIVYEMKKKPAFHAALEALELGAYEDSDGS